MIVYWVFAICFLFQPQSNFVVFFAINYGWSLEGVYSAFIELSPKNYKSNSYILELVFYFDVLNAYLGYMI